VREAVGDEALFEACEEGGLCFGKLAGQANADYGSWCMVNKYDGKWLLKYELYNVAEKDILFTKEYDSYDPKNLSDLVDIIKHEVPSTLREKMLGIKPEVNPPIETSFWDTEVTPSFWVAFGLDVLGMLALGYALIENENALDSYYKYSYEGHPQSYYDDEWKKVEDSRNNRNLFYIIGGVILASGIGVHICF